MLTDKNIEIIFNIHRIYIKDISFESPNTPSIFKKKWEPEIKIDFNISSNNIIKNIYEVILHVNVTANISKNTAFLCTVKQAGIFTIKSIDNKKIQQCIGSYCPDILFPYARECISNQITRGSFPQINLAPINFEALFKKHLQKNINKNTNN